MTVHRRYYEVPLNAYLFVKRRKSGEELQPTLFEDTSSVHLEEAVRQWCLFELLSRYGVSIESLTIEAPVRVGSKQYRVDVLVKGWDGKPFIVMECKKRGFSDHDDAMEQAISYADSAEMKAEFAAYTNGQEWRVKRRSGSDWVTVADIPVRQPDRLSFLCIADTMRTADRLWPILHKLGEPVSAKEASRFFGTWQTFFHTENQVTDGTNSDLGIAMDNLFRVAKLVTNHEGYPFGKAADAWIHIRNFSDACGYRFCTDEHFGQPFPLREQIQEAECCIHGFLTDIDPVVIEDKQERERLLKTQHPDQLLLRLLVELLRYLHGCLGSQPKRRARHMDIPQTFHDAAHAYLACRLKLNWDCELPPWHDHIAWGDIRSYTKPAWDNTKSER